VIKRKNLLKDTSKDYQQNELKDGQDQSPHLHDFALCYTISFAGGHRQEHNIEEQKRSEFGAFLLC